MSKCVDDFNEFTKQIKHDLEYGELNGSAVKTAYLGMIAAYLATIIDRLNEMNNKEYESRLKTDLEQLDSEIQEQIAFMGYGEETNGMKRADNLVKDKINALKQSIWKDNYNGKKETNNG